MKSSGKPNESEVTIQILINSYDNIQLRYKSNLKKVELLKISQM